MRKGSRKQGNSKAELQSTAQCHSLEISSTWYPVHIKDMGTTGPVAGAAKTPKSYLVETENATVRRNRSHVNPIPTNKPVSPSALDKPISPIVEKKQP